MIYNILKTNIIVKDILSITPNQIIIISLNFPMMNTWIKNFNLNESKIIESYQSYHIPESSSTYVHNEDSCAQFNRWSIDKIYINERYGSRFSENHGETQNQKFKGKKLKIESFLKIDRLSDLKNIIQQYKKEQFVFLLRNLTHFMIKCLLLRAEKLFLLIGEN